MNRWRLWLSRRPVGRARLRALAVLVVTGVAAVVLAALSHQAWPPVALAIVFTVPGVYLAWPAERSSAPETAAGILARGGPVAQWDVRRLGVHAAISVAGVADEVPPEYVPRDVDGGEFGVRARVEAAARRGGFVLLVGGSSVGKTRCAAQAVAALLPSWWLVRAGTPGQVAALAAACRARAARCASTRSAMRALVTMLSAEVMAMASLSLARSPVTWSCSAMSATVGRTTDILGTLSISP
jgi:hypothetical protein